MSEIVVLIPRINCSGCVKKVRGVLEALPGVEVVDADPGSKAIHIRYISAQTPLATIRSALTSARYPIADEQTVEQ